MVIHFARKNFLSFEEFLTIWAESSHWLEIKKPRCIQSLILSLVLELDILGQKLLPIAVLKKIPSPSVLTSTLPLFAALMLVTLVFFILLLLFFRSLELHCNLIDWGKAPLNPMFLWWMGNRSAFDWNPSHQYHKNTPLTMVVNNALFFSVDPVTQKLLNFLLQFFLQIFENESIFDWFCSFQGNPYLKSPFCIYGGSLFKSWSLGQV